MNIRPATAMILAAGFGTRMGALTQSQPKPMLPVANRPMIDRALDHARLAGVERCVVNLHYLGDQIRSHLGQHSGPRIAFSEEAEILDTGGGVAHALPLLGERPFYTINSDAVFVGENPLEVLARAWKPALDGLLLLVPTTSAIAYTRAGDFFLDSDGVAPTRRGTASSAPFIYAGAQILSPHAMTDAPSGPFSLNLIWNRLLTTQRLAAVIYPGHWVDVGTPDGLAAANEAVAGALE